MPETSDPPSGGNRGECPQCGAELNTTYSNQLTESTCSACNAAIWHVCINNKLFVFDGSRMTAEAWNKLEANIPQNDDESIVILEKILYLESPD